MRHLVVTEPQRNSRWTNKTRVCKTHCSVRILHFRHPNDWLLGDNKDVGGCLRSDVTEGNTLPHTQKYQDRAF